VWRRPDPDGYDWEKIGLLIETHSNVPDDLRGDIRREYFDTRIAGKSAQGHDYPNRLTEEQKRQLLEYLKTL
jgi:hypothetical protein